MNINRLALKAQEYKSLKEETVALMRIALGNELYDGLFNLVLQDQYALFIGTLEVLGMDKSDADHLWRIVS